MTEPAGPLAVVVGLLLTVAGLVRGVFGWPLSGVRALGVLIGVKLVSAGAVALRVERRMERVGSRVATVRSGLRG